MIATSSARRICVAVTAIGIAGYLLRPQLSDALVIRGDEALYRGQPRVALARYRRAVVFDGSDGVAIDRYLFVATMLRDRAVLADGIALAGRYLAVREDGVVRMDRGMAYRALGAWSEAAREFGRVGMRRSDPVALTFAGDAALRAGARTTAIAFLRQACRLSPGFLPAVHALVRAGRRG